jgi:delta endotoxin, N-terminal domain
MADKPKPGDPDYNPILDKLSWEETPRTIVIGVVGLVPEVGGVFSKLVSLVWPDPKDAATLIKESEEKMKAWVKLEIEKRIAQYDTEKLGQLLEGLRANLKWYSNIHNEQWLTTCIASFDLVKPMFLNPQDYIGSLPLIQALGTLHIGLLREPVIYFDQIFGPNAPSRSREFYKQQLTDTIANYKDFVVNKAVPKVLERRKGQIKIDTVSSGISDSYMQLVDEGRDIKQAIKSYSLGRQYKEYYENVLDVNLKKDVVDVALTWPILDPNSQVKELIPKDRVVWIGPVGISLSDYTSAPHFRDLANGLTRVQSPVRYILLKHGVILDFILLRDGGPPLDGNGNRRGLMVGNDKGGTKAEIRVPEGEYIKQVDTYWNYTCMGIQFHYTNGAPSAIFGNGDGRPKAVFKAAYPDHILQSIAVYGNNEGISEFYFGFLPNPKTFQ